MKRYFELKDGKSAKFWEIQLAASTLTTRYGRIGTLGQNWVKDYGSDEKAHAELEKLVKEKLVKGYIELCADGIEEIKASATKPTQQTRYFELKGRKTNQFVEISINGKILTRRDGDIGCLGESHVFERKNLEKAGLDYDKLVQILLDQGYKETSPPAPEIYEPETAYFEHPEQNYFFEVSENDNHLLIRRGVLGKPCLVFHASYVTPNRGRENFERLVKKWQKKGFVQTKPSIPIVEGSVAEELFADKIEDHPVYSRFFELGWASELRGQNTRIFLFRNGLIYDRNLDLEEVADMDLEAGLIVEGDVRVNGVFSQLSYTYPDSTLITGSVYAQSLGHKDSHMRIDGDVRVENIVYGEYNDGSLQIGGDVYGTAWISADHDMWASGTYHLPTFSWGDNEGLSPKLLDLEGRLDWDALREFIWAGKNPLRKDFVFIPPEPKAEPEPEPPKSDLCNRVQVLVANEDVEGLTQLLETWPEHNQEWMEMVQGRRYAPSTTPEQKARLTAVLDRACAQQPEIPVAVLQVETFAEADPAIKKIIEKMKGINGVKNTLKALETPLEPELVKHHSQILFINALIKNKDFPGEYLPVVQRLLDLGADPRMADPSGRVLIYDSLVYEQADVVALLQAFFPDTTIWTFPASGQVEEPQQAHPRIAALLNQLLYQDHKSENCELMLKALETPPDKDLTKCHSWVLLYYLLQQTYLNRGYQAVIERLLELGVDPRVEFEGMDTGVVHLAGILDLYDVLELFYKRYPELRPETECPPETIHGVEVLHRLIEFEDAGADFESAEIKSWLESIVVIRVAMEKLKRIPESLRRLVNLRSLGLKRLTLKTGRLTLKTGSVPDSLGNLSKLEELFLSGNKLTQLPDAFSKLTQLKNLNLQDNKLKSLPILPNLERLTLDNNWTLGSFDLSLMPKLKFLSLGGLKNLPTGFEHLLELEELSLMNCQLQTLPEAIFSLPNLREINLDGNPMLALKQLERLREKGVLVYADDAGSLDEEKPPRPKKTSHSRNVLKQVKQLNQQGSYLQQSNPTEALLNYQQVLDHCAEFLLDFPDDFAYEHLFALQASCGA